MIFPPLPIYLYRDVVDFRKSINGLVVIVEEQLARSPFDAGLFLFCNKNRDKIKILYWDKTGFALWYKRLEKDRFKWPRRIGEREMTLSEQQLSWLLEGYDIIGHKPLIFSQAS